MKPGSVIVDLAGSQGGNCPLSELNKTVIKHGAYIVGEPDLATLVAADAWAVLRMGQVAILDAGAASPRLGGQVDRVHTSSLTRSNS